MSRVIAVANQKGGVAKTTTVASLAAGAVELGKRALVVDLDPQACLTFSLGLDPDALELSIHDVLLGRVSAGMVIRQTADGVDVLPSTIDLAGCETVLLTKTGREYQLRLALDDLTDYDLVLIDCPPSLGVLTINALTAADEVLIPLQCETLSHRGVGQLLDTVHDVQRLTNRDLKVLGVLPTLFDGRTSHAREVLADVSARYGLDVLDPPIAKSIRFAEAPAAGRTVLCTASRTRGAEAYRDLSRQLLGLPPKEDTVVDLTTASPEPTTAAAPDATMDSLAEPTAAPATSEVTA
jgi:chromosome partitioning protein